jgi:hypothetical protein
MGHVFLVLPFTAIIPAGIFAWLFWRSRSLLCLLSSVVWLMYTVYEYGMYLRILCTGECNIRIDLLLIYPILLLSSLLAIAGHILKRKHQGTERSLE